MSNVRTRWPRQGVFGKDRRMTGTEEMQRVDAPENENAPEQVESAAEQGQGNDQAAELAAAPGHAGKLYRAPARPASFQQGVHG